MRFLILADPTPSLKADFDSGLTILREHLDRGHEMYWALADDFLLDGTELQVSAEKITECLDDALPSQKEPKKWLKIKDFDGVWIRKDPPFDLNYLSLCWLLSLEKNSTVILNPPETLATSHEKLLPLLAHREGYLDREEVLPFLMSTGTDYPMPDELKSGEIITKPWFGHGGRGVQKWNNLDEILNYESSTKNSQNTFNDPVSQKEYIIFQKFRPSAISRGDRRVFFFCGEQVGSFLRIPKPGTIIATIAQGGTAKMEPLTPKEKRICEKLTPFLKKRDIVFAGIDLMDECLSEINITAPSGIRLFERLSGKRIQASLVDEMLRRVKLLKK